MDTRLRHKQLVSDDAKAVDLLLDPSARTDQPMYAVPKQDGLEKRVRNVEAVLKLLQEMPAEEPPVDLAQRTLEHIQRSAYGAHRPPAHAPAAQVQSRHHA